MQQKSRTAVLRSSFFVLGVPAGFRLQQCVNDQKDRACHHKSGKRQCDDSVYSLLFGIHIIFLLRPLRPLS